MLVNINILINLQVRCPDCDGGFYHGMAYGTGFTTITKTTNSIGGGYYSGTGTTRKYQLSLLTTNTWQRSTADASGTPPATAGAVPQALHDSLLTPAKIPCCGKYTPIQGPVVVRTGRYRFGFNGQELDNEVTGVTGSHLAFEYRIHDARIGRFLSMDPIAGKFPWNSPYAFAENQLIAFVELEGLEKATPQQQQNALNTLNTFADDKNTTTVWNNVSKQDFVSSLTNMLNNPGSIEQRNTNLCGIAVSCKASIEYDPETFANMALSLYQTGKYGNYQANSNLYNNAASNGLDAAGFVVMTSIRNSLNVFGYNPTTDDGLSGLTWPRDVDQILTKTMDMTKTTNTDWPSTPTNGTYLQGGITKAVNAGHIVILTVNINHFMGSSTWSITPDHYIQVTGITENPDGTINVSWWSWGKNQTPKKMTKEQLYKSTYFYGSFE